MIKNIIFDLGNVLFSFNPVAYFETVFKENSAKYCNRIFKNEIWNQYDQGIITKQVLYDYVKMNYPSDIKEMNYILDHWIEILIEIKTMSEMIPKLYQQGYHLYILSNVSEEGIKILDGVEWMNYVDGYIYSYEYQINKPDPRLYQILLAKYQLKASECVFLDDREANIESAIKLGMRGIVVENSQQAIEDLEKLLC